MAKNYFFTSLTSLQGNDFYYKKIFIYLLVEKANLIDSNMQMNYHLTVVHHNGKIVVIVEIVVTVKDERESKIKYTQMLKVITRAQNSNWETSEMFSFDKLRKKSSNANGFKLLQKFVLITMLLLVSFPNAADHLWS